MGRTKRSAKLETRSARLRLATGRMHQEPLAPGRYLAYRRPGKGGAGSWLARWRRDGKIVQHRVGTADDFYDADGRDILAFSQAQAKAQAWFDGQSMEAAAEEDGEPVRRGAYTVSDAMHDYLQDAKRRGVKGLPIMTTTIRAHILPALGEVEVAKLTKRRVENWLTALAEAPRRKTGKVREEVEHLPDPVTEDERRARKDSANRVLTNLKSALNHALATRRYSGPAPWRDVQKFKGVGVARVRFLSPVEQRRLVNVCPPGFKELVQAALYTGCRYSELCRLKVRDFDAKAKTIFIAVTKSGRPRHIVLTEESAAWFTGQVTGRPAAAALLQKPNAKGIARKHQEDPLGWGPHDQKRLMGDACEKAKVEPLGFHELRHTYASGLVNAGVPLAYVAEQLGHVDTAMVEKHYGHLSPSAMAKSIRQLAPKLRFKSAPRVKPLKIAGAGK